MARQTIGNSARTGPAARDAEARKTPPPVVRRWTPAGVRPKKPYPDFPLFPHATGRWAKKIRGRFVFFGPWDDAQGAIERYVTQRDALMAGLVPRAHPVGAPSRSRQPGPLTGDSFPSSRVAATRPTSGHGANGRRWAGSGGTVVNSAAGRDVAGDVGDPVDPDSNLDGPEGEPPQRLAAGTLTLRDLVNRFLTAKQRRVESGELGPQSFADYLRIYGRVIKAFGPHRPVHGMGPADFTRLRDLLSKTRGPFALGCDITKVRTLFRFAVAEGLMEREPRYGPGFDKPSKKTIRLARGPSGSRMFEPEEIAKLLAGASVQMRAMILLGLNCGMGNTDVASLPRSALDLPRGMLEFPRPKTGVARRAILWPETVEALKAVAKVRPAAASTADRGLVFLTKYGKPWARVSAPQGGQRLGKLAVAMDAVYLSFSRLAKEVGVQKPGRAFYSLRHTFRTVADEIGDRRAIDLIMGHENGQDISNHYVERIGDERIARVVEHVRAWMKFPAE